MSDEQSVAAVQQKLYSMMVSVGERMTRIETSLERIGKDTAETHDAVFKGNGDPPMRHDVRAIKRQLSEYRKLFVTDIEALQQTVAEVEGWKKTEIAQAAERAQESEKQAESKQHWFRKVVGWVAQPVATAGVLAAAIYFDLGRYFS